MEESPYFLHEQVYEDLKNKISEKQYAYGEMLPKEMDLMLVYNVSRHTIRKAMERLNNEGYIYKIRGQGTFVKSTKADYKLSNMSSFSEIISNQEGEPSSIVIESKEIPLTEELKIKTGFFNSDTCYYIERVRRNGKINLCYEISYIDKKLCPNIINYVTPNASLYKLYEEKYHLELGDGDFRLEAVNANPKIAKILDIEHKASVLYMQANISTKNDKPLYFVKAYYIGSRYTFSMQLKR